MFNLGVFERNISLDNGLAKSRKPIESAIRESCAAPEDRFDESRLVCEDTIVEIDQVAELAAIEISFARKNESAEIGYIFHWQMLEVDDSTLQPVRRGGIFSL
jgi:hypothetical protein